MQLDQSLDIFDLALHVPGFLNSRDCGQFIDFFDNHQDQAYRENSVDVTGRRLTSTFDCVTMPDTSPTAQNMLAHVTEVVRLYRRHLIQKSLFHDYIIQNLSFNYVRRFRVLRYGMGASIHAHIDAEPWVYGSVTINLNRDYSGGDFVFMRGLRKIALGLGDALIFPADMFWVHETLPIESGTRYTFNCFLQSIPWTEQQRILNDLPDMHHIADCPTYIHPREDRNMIWT